MSDASASRKWAGRGIQLALVVVAVALAVHWVGGRFGSATDHLHVSDLKTLPDTLGPGDLRIYNSDSTMDLVLIGDKLAAGLSPKMVAKIRQHLDSSKSSDSGLGGSIAGLVKNSVAGAIGSHAEFPLKDLRDLRFENGHFVFDWKSGGEHVLFKDTSVNGEKTDNTFGEADAQRFTAAVKARQKELGFIP